MLALPEVDCFSNLSQDFLICTTVHKASQLGVFTGDIYVQLSLGKMSKSTKVFSNSENPFFNEYFVFELKCKLDELLRMTLSYEVRKRIICKKDVVLGAVLIDLQNVWNQNDRCFFKKWGQLESVVGVSKSASPKGYLQIDLAIVSKACNVDALQSRINAVTNNTSVGNGDVGAVTEDIGEAACTDVGGVSTRWQLNTDFDDIDKHLLQDADLAERCNILYRITFYKAVLTKKGDYTIQYRFHLFKGKTSVCKNTAYPMWNEEITFAWSFPSLAQTLLIELLIHEHLTWKCVADLELYFDEIAFKDKPFLGPTYLHLYDAQHPTQYIGRLLIHIQSECISENVPRQLRSSQVPPFNEQSRLITETFLVEFIALRGDFLHGNLSNVKVSLKLAESVSNYVECYLKNYPTLNKNTRSLKFFKQSAPFKAIYLKISLQNGLLKYESNLFMQEIVNYIKNEIETFKMFQLKYADEFQIHAKCLRAIILNIITRIKIGIALKSLEYDDVTDRTKWDINRQEYLEDYFRRLQNELDLIRQKLKFVSVKYVESIIESAVQSLVKFTQDVVGLMVMGRTQDDWPDLFIVLSMGNNKDLALCKLNAKGFLRTSKNLENNDTSCWRPQNFAFKDIHCNHACINCGCTIGIIQGCLTILIDDERDAMISQFSQDWEQPEPFYWSPKIRFSVFKCRVFIHQAKVRPGYDQTGVCDPYVRVVLGGQSAETHTELGTLSPIWNVVVAFDRISLPGALEWYLLNPPVMALEVYDSDKYTSDDYLGCGMLTVSVLASSVYDINPEEQDAAFRYRLSEHNKNVKTRVAMKKFQELKNLSPPSLKWIPIAANGLVNAEVLIAAELIPIGDDKDEESFETPSITQGIPKGIRPIMRNYIMEVIFAGFRNYSKDGRHRVKIMMGELQLQSGLSSTRIKNSLNFLVLYASGVLSIPEQIEYWPAIIAADVLVSARGAETVVGAVLIGNSKRFLQKQLGPPIKCETPVMSPDGYSVASTTVHFEDDNELAPLIVERKSGGENGPVRRKPFKNIFGRLKWRGGGKKWLPPQPLFEEKSIKDGGTKLNWWSKFYNSLYPHSSELHKHKLIVYSQELENHIEFNYLHDWAEPVNLMHGVICKHKGVAVRGEKAYGTLKLQIKITPCQCESGGGGGGDCGGDMLRPLVTALNPKYQKELQAFAELCKIVVRVYVVQGLQIRHRDRNSPSDTYVKLQLGSKILCNRPSYIPNEFNPIFGTSFQLEGVIPREHMLEISLFDRDHCRDDLVGSTFIDLEDRWRSKHRATVGIAKEYSKKGYNKWRDIFTPYDILLDLCKRHDVKPPIFTGDSIEIDGEVFTDQTEIEKEEDLQERLSLTVLHNLERLPSFGYVLVPEHIETRSLYRKDYPGIAQGKIQLWIELYDGNVNIPPAIDITPQPPQAYELRVIIHDCADVILQERNFFGTKMSDIYVRGWCSDSSQTQSTDIHYRSLDGAANFNWRMIFPIKYSKTEDVMVVKRRSGLDAYDNKQPPILVLQVWDGDLLTKDDFLGTLEINLSNFPEPFDTAKLCVLPSHKTNSRSGFAFSKKVRQSKPINLFEKQKIRGWFPIIGSADKDSPQPCDTPVLTGKIDLSLEIVTEADAIMNPCGLGRDPPRALPMPARPETSFNPLTSPVKSVKKIIMPFCKRLCLWTLFLVIIFGTIVVLILQFPTIVGNIFTT